MAITKRAWMIYFCITESKEFSLKKELLLNQEMTFPFNKKVSYSYEIHA